MDEKFLAGVDIGGTWVRAAICTADLNEKNIKKTIIKTPKENKFSISNSICQILSEIFSENNINVDQILGIGIATAGPLNMEKGEVFNSINLGFKVIPLMEPIKKKFPEIQLYILNDGNAGVLGIHYFEAETDEKDNLVFITMSTGLGGGVICNGRLLLGKEGNAAEVGHVLVDPKSKKKCNCGASGCWEAYSSGTGVENRTLDALNEGKLNSSLLKQIVKNNLSKITAKEVFEAAKKGDELSSKIVEDCIFYTKVGIGVVNNCYDCVSIYFGGAMMKDKDQIIPLLIEQFEKDPIRFTVNHPPRIKSTKFENEIGLMGALALVKYKVEKNKIIS
ncbi:MAG: ROK family protein [Promethearchaeota archaeon]|nr:MAG: ROK family protein [Candidatus Lokiarchaeota archaeon]